MREVYDGRLDRDDTTVCTNRRPYVAIESELAMPSGGSPRTKPHREGSDTASGLDAAGYAGTDHGAAERSERQRLDRPITGDSNGERLTEDSHHACLHTPYRDVITAWRRLGSDVRRA